MPPTPPSHPLPLAYVITRAQHLLLLSQDGLGQLLGTSERTVQRWMAKQSSPYPKQLQHLADAVRHLDADIAARLDAFAPRPPQPPPALVAPPAPPPPPATPDPVLVDAIVCAAAEAMAVTPQAVRPALLAACVRAQQCGVSLETLARQLAPPPPAPPAEPDAPAARLVTRR